VLMKSLAVFILRNEKYRLHCNPERNVLVVNRKGINTTPTDFSSIFYPIRVELKASCHKCFVLKFLHISRISKLCILKGPFPQDFQGSIYRFVKRQG
jgi:hypothetical protein